ncbi:hypothetical protein HanRHA438_Chr06g0270021 [Helianthus annuus]|nr:hypothetical protein HanRHA438_Chr06g0270021 [Helianthus annuus]
MNKNSCSLILHILVLYMIFITVDLQHVISSTVFSESLVFVAANDITQTRITCKDCKHGGHFSG